MHEHLVRPRFSWPEPFSSSQGRKTQNKEPKSHRTSPRNVVWTDCCAPFLQQTCSQDLQQDVITLPANAHPFPPSDPRLNPPPQPNPLINCTFCSTADRRDLSRLIKLTFVVALVMKTIMKTYLNNIIKTKLAIYQLSASWNIQTAIRWEREREKVRQYGIGTISQHVSSRKNKKTKKVKHLGTINIQRLLFFFSFSFLLFA